MLFTLGVTVEHSCPTCGSANTSVMAKISYVTFLLALFSALYIKIKKTEIMALIDIMILLAVLCWFLVGGICSMCID